MPDINEFNYPEDQWATLDIDSRHYWRRVVLRQYNNLVMRKCGIKLIQSNFELNYVLKNGNIYSSYPVSDKNDNRHVIARCIDITIKSAGISIRPNTTVKYRNQSSILINMIDNSFIGLPMIRYYIETYKPNLMYHSFQYTALTAAISQGRNDVVRMLIDMPGVDINRPSRVNRGNWHSPIAADLTPLMCAIDNNNTEAVNILLDCKGIDVNYKNIYGLTALIMAYNKLWTVYNHILNRRFTENDADFTTRTRRRYGDTYYTIHIDYLRGRTSKTELRDTLSKTIPYFQRLYTYPGIHQSMQYVIKNRFGKDEHGKEGAHGYFSYHAHPYPYRHGEELRAAIVANDDAAVDRLLANDDIDVNFVAGARGGYVDSPTLHLAIMLRRMSSIRKLTQHPRIDMSQMCWDTEITNHWTRHESLIPRCGALHLACESGTIAIVNCILEHPDTDVNNIGVLSRKTALMVSAHQGDVEIVHRLLEVPNIDVNRVSCKYTTNRGERETFTGHAARYAMKQGNEDIARAIMTHSGAARHLYRHVLYEAAAFEIGPIVGFCLELGKRDNRTVFQRCKLAAFFNAVKHGSIAIAELLYEAKQFRTKHYAHKLFTALCTSIDGASMDTLKFLVTKTCVDINGLLYKTECSPLAAAIVKNDMDKVLFLLKQPTLCDTNAIQHVAEKLASYASVGDTVGNSITMYLSMLIDRRLYTEDTLHEAFCKFIMRTGKSGCAIDCLKVLSRAPGFDANRKHADGRSYLMLATKHHKDIVREIMCIRRECRALTEINVLGSLCKLPTEILRIIRDCMMYMPIPKMSKEDTTRAMFAEDDAYEVVSEGEEMRAAYTEDDAYEVVSEGEEMRAAYTEDDALEDQQQSHDDCVPFVRYIGTPV
jgi:ankyrin repeat protein